jgi:hypothetical protein
MARGRTRHGADLRARTAFRILRSTRIRIFELARKRANVNTRMAAYLAVPLHRDLPSHPKKSKPKPKACPRERQIEGGLKTSRQDRREA